MTDEQIEGEQLKELFAEGTAPERDAAFARRVDARIASERLAHRLLMHATRVLIVLAFAALLFVALRELRPMLDPTLQQIAEYSPHFMGVPAPLILAVLAIGLAVRALQFVRLRLR